MAARAPPAAPAAEESGGPGGPPRRKKSRSGASGLRRAFNWLRGKRRKKKAAGAEGAESAAPRAKKADDKARRTKGKGRGKAPGTWAARRAVPTGCGQGGSAGGLQLLERVSPWALVLGQRRAQGSARANPVCAAPKHFLDSALPRSRGRDPRLGQGSPGLSRKCWQSGSCDGEAIPHPPGSPRFCPLLSQGVRD